MEFTGAQALVKSLEMQEVEVVFGLPGGAILPVYDPIIDSPIRHVLVRHEQGAGHMAEGYAHATGRPGVAMVTAVPARPTSSPPLADAYMDSMPLVCITGQVADGAIGTDAFQECDIDRLTLGDHQAQLACHRRRRTSPRSSLEAFHVATTGSPGPVLIDFPKDVANADHGVVLARAEDLDLPGYHPESQPDPAAIAGRPRSSARPDRPVLYVGGGVLKAQRLGGPARAGGADRASRS